MPHDPNCPPPDPNPRPPRRKAPPGATDCHAHIIGPAAEYPFVRNRSYTPPDALLPDYLKVLKTLGFGRAVLVQPSMHGTDNSVMMRAIAQARDIDMRTVVVVPPETGRDELLRLHDQGARGVRINLVYAGGDVGFRQAGDIARSIADLGWHIQFLADISQLGEGLLELERLPVPLVFDHFGHFPASKGSNDPGFTALLELVKRGRAWVKLSGAYRIAASGLPYPEIRPLCEALVAAGQDRLVWGTDWPHTVCPREMPNDGDLFDVLGDWLGGDELLEKVLVRNPAELYGF